MARRQRPDIDPMSRAQALNFLGAMTGVGGYADMLGQYPPDARGRRYGF